jgi:hypothetical protein
MVALVDRGNISDAITGAEENAPSRGFELKSASPAAR